MDGAFTMVMEGLSCPNCAAKIETKIKTLPQVEHVSLNLMTQEAVIQTASSGVKDTTMKEIKKIVHTYEPDVNVYEKGVSPHAHSPEAASAKSEDNRGLPVRKILFVFGIIAYGVAILAPFDRIMQGIFYGIAYISLGYRVLFTAFNNIKRGEIFDENFLMTLATFGAFAIGEWAEAVGVMLFYNIGENLQDMALDRSRRSIQSLMDLKPDFARVIHDGHMDEVPPESVLVGDRILVKPGERIPLDGIILKGETQLDTSAVTGEYVPRVAKAGDTVLSGCINVNGVIELEVTKNYGESTVAKIMELVENASAKKAPVEKFITRFAKVYTPIVVLLAALIIIVPTFIYGFATLPIWLKRGLTFLVISCPCALVVSVPLTLFSGIGAASKRGILIKGSNFVQSLESIDTILFDKTGTLTEGVFSVSSVVPADSVTAEDLVFFAAMAEQLSNHPIAESICNYYNKALPGRPESYEEIAGHGVKAVWQDAVVYAGNSRMMEKEQISFEAYHGLGSVVHVAKDGAYLGYIVVSDKIKDSAKKALDQLGAKGYQRVMLTGDHRENAEKTGEFLQMDAVYAELLPQDKLVLLESFIEDKGKKVAFVGDGINDAPSLTRAAVGIAMGGIGSDAAIEAADIVIMQDDMEKIGEAFTISQNTNRILKQNIIFILLVKTAVLILGALGMANMWMAVFADVGVTLLAVLSAMRKKI